MEPDEWAVVVLYEDEETTGTPRARPCMLVERGTTEADARAAVAPEPGLEPYADGLLAVKVRPGCGAEPGDDCLTDGETVWTGPAGPDISGASVQ